MSAQWQNPRKIRERILINGNLVLTTPALLGGGDAESLVDMPLLLDPLEGRTLLTGSSIAGALRNYLRKYNREQAEILFGSESTEKTVNADGQSQDDEQVEASAGSKGEEQGSSQSLLFVDDALGDKPEVELRDGVAVDPRTGTAEEKAKYDLELLQAGSSFCITFELLLRQDLEKTLTEGLAVALQGLEKREIAIGGRKSRGFGRCKINQWEVVRYDMTKPEGLIAWLDRNRSGCLRGTNIAALLGVKNIKGPMPDIFTLQALFQINGSLINRSPGHRELSSGGQKGISLPDAVHLHSQRNGVYVPVASGTSLAGALLSRSIRIANTLGKDGYALANEIFGHRRLDKKDRTKPTASRLWVEETVIQNPLALVQSRIKIDRFTGGVYPGALFHEQPVFGKGDTLLEVNLRLENPKDYEIGLPCCC